ncbi:MAG: CRISPR-associated protein Cmr3 [Acaryochloridaceae cyanobacterium RU_4_10]|nr:CRISPR-associated protein Cmr3 [Acaryochloridaceae cyanobacterium RU_4_10]
MSQSQESHKFQYLITIEPLGLLYGSAGAFLSPENLVGRSGAKFPPSAVTLAGLFAAAYAEQGGKIEELRLAGPFWSFTDDIQNFCVPTPFHLIAKLQPNPNDDANVPQGQVEQSLTWHPQSDTHSCDRWENSKPEQPNSKTDKDTWIPVRDWHRPQTVYGNPWKFVPHLHPKLQHDQRRVVDSELGGGSLFLENAVQIAPDTCLTYLSNKEIQPGWYRFGGEGHLVSVTKHHLDSLTQDLLNTSLGHVFALITPALWGSNRKSLRYPEAWESNVKTMLTERPHPFRYRLGGKDKDNPHKPTRLSRGRYAVPAGTVYVMEQSWKQKQSCWYDWTGIFPKEGYELNTWGCGLALPLDPAIAPVLEKAITS